MDKSFIKSTHGTESITNIFLKKKKDGSKNANDYGQAYIRAGRHSNYTEYTQRHILKIYPKCLQN